MYKLDDLQTLTIAILVLFLGKKLNKEISFLREYNIPEPVTGGVLASIVVGAIYLITNIELTFSLGNRDVLLLVFFTTIGLSAQIRSLIEGGKSLVILLFCAVIYLYIQNFTGVGLAKMAGMDPVMGLLGGSVSLSGGHGTAIAWSDVFINKYGIPNAMEISIACATFGLVLGGLVGGPIAEFLITRNKLHPNNDEKLQVGVKHDKVRLYVDYYEILNSILIIGIAMGTGIYMNLIISELGLKLPLFVTCLFGGILLTNTIPNIFKKIEWPTNTNSLALISDLSLGLFLSMSLMSLQLWTLIDLAGPILLLLVVQVLVVTAYVILVVFRLMGKDYDAAVISAGYVGLALGATPTAIANMAAVTKKFGISHKAFLIVPLVGAFFVDISNAFIIQSLLDLIQYLKQ